MTTAPEVSVVMSVCNGATRVRESAMSVLAQEGVALELVVVDDGSTDGSGALLDGMARADPRLRVIHQDNQGLTRALVRGCAAATAPFIARQDCGDASLPGRLAAELRIAREQPSAALVSCGTRFIGPEGEPLYEVAIGASEAMDGLRTVDPGRLRGPAHHGSVLFRREVYERVGGYREQFHFAQDLDLWVRLAEQGRHVAIPDVLYEASFTPGSISGLYRDRQIACAGIIVECAGLRRAGQSEAEALARAAAIVPGRGTATSANRAAALYFLGVCLRKRADPRARQYFREALRAYPLHVKSAVRLLFG
jgi:cellulose synthase/poly-beta-1,6-N-acetylglucosamine synthase-like glycosyltransferase